MLELMLARHGALRFATEVIAPLNELIGNEWARGNIAIFEEHAYADLVQQLLRQAAAQMQNVGNAPRVLLTTVPGEEHQLGLLMAQVCLSVEGAHCVALGAQTPNADVVRAVRAHAIDIVGLSFSEAVPVHRARDAVGRMREQLDPHVALWVGGSVWKRSSAPCARVTIFPTLESIPAALAVWRQQHPRRAAA
jgi:methanogenic corrinoid protein MtbC1